MVSNQLGISCTPSLKDVLSSFGTSGIILFFSVLLISCLIFSLLSLDFNER